MPDVDVVKDDRAWVARFDGEVAGELVWRESRDRSAVVLVHTEVADGYEGRGVGSALVRAALDALAAADCTVRPDCPFVHEWLERHPDHPVRVTHRS